MTPFTLLPGSKLSEPRYAASLSAIEDSICHPPCECVDCQTGFYGAQEQYQPQLSYRRRLSDDEAKTIASSYVKQISEARANLAQRLSSHADVLMSRWKKRSQDKRQTFLKDVAPDLEEKKWILPRYSYMPERKLIHCRSQSRRRQLILPWLNVEVLKANPAVLFALLHYRTFYPPQDWAAFDCRQLTLSWACGWLDVDYSAKCVVMYGQSYGEVVDWVAGPTHRADILGFPRARLVLEAQAYLMDVLFKVVDKVLDGVDDSQVARTDKWRELTTTAGFKRTGDVEFWSLYTNQAFSAPPLLNTGYLLSLAKTRLNEVGDHLWWLQCDTGYMRRHIKILFSTEIYKRAQDAEVGSLLATHACREVLSYFWWRWVEIECRHADQMRKRFSDSTSPGCPLPIAYDRALGALELLLVNQVIYRTKCLEKVLPFTPGFSKHWSLKRNANLPQGAALLQRTTPTNTEASLEKDPLDWCLVQMLGMPDEQKHFDHAMLFAFLQDHLASNAWKERARLDEMIYRNLSDISTCHEMLVSVRLHRPQNRPRDIEEVEQSENREGWKQLRREPPTMSKEAAESIGSALVKDLYRQPAPNGPKNTAWLRRSQTTRTALEKFWASIRETIQRSFDGSAFSSGEIRSLLEIISANLSSDYREAVRSEEMRILAGKEESVDPFLTHFLNEHEVGPQSKLTIVQRRPKTKTRGEKQADDPHPQPTEEQQPQSQSSEKPETAGPTFVPVSVPVTRRALEVFALMFPRKGDRETSRSVDWDRFVHAMTDAGFTARSNGGSAVLFETHPDQHQHQRLPVEGKIVFHKPHPVSKIDTVMMRHMGKRMAKWFGWSREVFVVVDQSSGLMIGHDDGAGA